MYRKSIIRKRLETKHMICARMRAAKSRKRVLRAIDSACEWQQHETLLRWSVSPDGRHVGLKIGERWEVCGSERTVRAKLARAMWRKCTRDHGGLKTRDAAPGGARAVTEDRT